LDILKLKSDDVILDLGAYSGFSSIVFSLDAPLGTVVAVEADPKCQIVVNKNLEAFASLKPNKILFYPYAIHSSIGFLDFISEGTMASSVVDLAHDSWMRPQTKIQVPTKTLSALVYDLGLKKVDVIKADIEGSEYDAFLDQDFFKAFHPKILIEPISKNGPKGSAAIEALLRCYGYEHFIFIKQEGGHAPLMFCQ